MKKILIFITVFFAVISNLGAQTNMFTSYTFNVEPKNEQTVLKLYNDYFGKKEHLIKGVAVSLYSCWLSSYCFVAARGLDYA